MYFKVGDLVKLSDSYMSNAIGRVVGPFVNDRVIVHILKLNGVDFEFEFYPRASELTKLDDEEVELYEF